MAAGRYRTDLSVQTSTPRPSGAPLALDHVQVAAPPDSQDQARDFYGGLLGLPELDRPDGLRDSGSIWFALGGGQLHVGVVQPFVAAAKAHPALRADSVEALRALAQRLTDAGAPVTWDERLEPDTVRLFTADPWGNRIELLARAHP